MVSYKNETVPEFLHLCRLLCFSAGTEKEHLLKHGGRSFKLYVEEFLLPLACHVKENLEKRERADPEESLAGFGGTSVVLRYAC